MHSCPDTRSASHILESPYKDMSHKELQNRLFGIQLTAKLLLTLCDRLYKTHRVECIRRTSYSYSMWLYGC